MRTHVSLKRHLLPVLFLLITCFSSKSQSVGFLDGKVELGLNLGPSFFLGDLGGTRGKGKTFVKDVNIPFTKLMKGLYLNIYPREWLGFRLAANFGELEAADSIISSGGKDEWFRKKRNLYFKSKLSEAYFAMEIYPTVFLEQYDGLQGKLRPYGLIGIGIYHFNPTAEYIEPNGERRWVDLKPLRLEGQGMSQYPDRKEYKLTQMNVPMGFGVKYYVKETMYIGLEVLHRKTFTDYIDDVSTKYVDPVVFSQYLSPQDAVVANQLYYRENLLPNYRPTRHIGQQRGDPTENDAYFSGLLRFGWRLNGDNSPNARAKKQLRCPVYF
ncbi:MAG: hypothetical protein E6H07_12320 [Bacteroidetes bacterium]|nr:MAG: hypothetical protein E6H07_12320 [Bacteroidota bacterium]